jgi:hypothetical protein
MPREYDLTALKPFDYEGRSFVEGESFRTGILGFIQLVGTLKARLNRIAPEAAPLAPAKKRPGRPKKKQADK